MKRILVTLLAAACMLFASAPKASAQNFDFNPDQIAQMRVDQMKQSLKLTADQTTKLLDLFKKETAEMTKMFEGGGMPDMSKFEENQKKSDEAIKKILTADQYKQYQEDQKKLREQFGGFGGF